MTEGASPSAPADRAADLRTAAPDPDQSAGESSGAVRHRGPGAGRTRLGRFHVGGGMGGRAFWTFATQGLSSASNFALSGFVLAAASARMFAIFSICLTTYLLLLQFARSVIGIPVLVGQADTAPADDARAASPEARATAGFALLAGLMVAPPLAAIGVLWAEAGPQFFVLAAAMPFLLTQDALRHVAIATGRPKVAALGDGAWVALQAVGSAAALAAGTESAAVLLAIWSGAGALSTLLLAFVLRVRPLLRSSINWLRSNRELCRHLAGEFTINSGSYYLLSYGLVVLAGSEQLGHLRAAQTLFGPASVLLLGGAVLGVPESVRARGEGVRMRRFAIALSAFLTLLSVICGVAVYVLLPTVGRHLFSSWQEVRAVMPWLTLFGAAIGAGAGAVAALRAVGASRWIRNARGLAGAMALAIGLPASVWFGAKGALVGLSVGECLLSARAWARLGAGAPAEDRSV